MMIIPTLTGGDFIYVAICRKTYIIALNQIHLIDTRKREHIMKLKHLPNTITLSRFVLVASLIFLTPLSMISIIVFTIAGVTDMVDGSIARNIKNAQSNLGAELDSMADMFMVVVSVFVIVPAMGLWAAIWPAILLALSFKLMSAVPGLIKHRKVFFLHTLANKVLGLLLFMGGIFYFIFGGQLVINLYFVFLIGAVFVATVEEMVIISLLNNPNKDIRGFWQIGMINAEFIKRKAD